VSILRPPAPGLAPAAVWQPMQSPARVRYSPLPGCWAKSMVAPARGATRVTSIAERITASGGKILNGPMEVPGGDWIVNAMDPQGAAFGLHARKA